MQYVNLPINKVLILKLTMMPVGPMLNNLFVDLNEKYVHLINFFINIKNNFLKIKHRFC